MQELDLFECRIHCLAQRRGPVGGDARPERPHFVEQLSESIPFYPLRHVIKPGITGWAQINFGYANTIEHTVEKLQYDLFYIKNMSWILDVLIMLETVKTVLVRKGS